MNRVEQVRRLVSEQRDRACWALENTGPSGATLCEGWTARELAIHLWQLNNDPLAWAGVAPGLKKLGEIGTARARRQLSHGAVVEQLRRGPVVFRCMPEDRRGEPLHSLGEWFIHSEDVLRAQGVRAEMPRYSPELQDALRRRIPIAAKAVMLGKPGATLVTPAGQQLRVGRHPERVTVTGEPSELMLWVYGRRAQALVRVV